MKSKYHHNLQHYHSYQKSNGYTILSVILVIVAVIVAISIWSLSGQATENNQSKQDVIVSSLINDSLAIKSSFDSLVISGKSSSSIVFLPNVASTAAAPNMLDTVAGLKVPKVFPSILTSGITNPKGFWVYSKKYAFRHLDNNNTPEYTVFIGGLKDDICEKINQNLYGPEADTPSTGTNSNVTLSGATPTNPNSSSGNIISTITDSVLSRATTGCFHNIFIENDSTFFRILQIN